ncbi:hypothetical protein [Microcoleus sp. FACHB-672]|uniref:hypothetical protein n=1 Tax=Microcoleus sp. FACHB-672 TaxID=2692825 RepID=UPI0016896E4B|nr:hypothetical protein [Microcoleus sp. FACHB-672]MBD2043730.1 hypothetical protein [Microcoleus sp. FACHB-672]
MKDYFKKTDFILDFLYFYYCGNRYQGRGFMTWNPEEGFHLQALLDSQVKPIEKIELGKVHLPSKSDIFSIRMRPRDYDWAIVPNISLSEMNKLYIQNKYLSINFERVVFCESVKPGSNENFWAGSALYETQSKLRLSDTVHTNIRINDQDIERDPRISGIFYEDDTQRKLIGRFIDNKQLKLYWKLPKELWSKAEAWKWSIAIQDVLSIWFGETIGLLQREFLRGSQKVTEIRCKGKFSTLGLLSPFGNLPFNKDAFISMAEFFIRDPSKADICRRILWQLLEASNQQSQQAQELLLSTILEASLRSLDNRPFSPKKDNSWNVGKSLESFFKTYLPSDEWKDICKQVMKEHCYLRDRNAHPDWLFNQSGRFSDEEQRKSLDSMILLSRFYGYMILALAGFKDLLPNFPPSHQTWNAAATITVTSNSNPENAFPDLHILGEMSDLGKLTKQLSQAKTYHERTIIWRDFKRGIN